MLGWMQEKWYISHYHPDQSRHYIMDPREEKCFRMNPTGDAQTLFPSTPNLHPWWAFYLQTPEEVFEENLDRTCNYQQQPQFSNHQSSAASSVYTGDSTTGRSHLLSRMLLCPHSLGPLPTHFEICLALSQSSFFLLIMCLEILRTTALQTWGFSWRQLKTHFTPPAASPLMTSLNHVAAICCCCIRPQKIRTGLNKPPKV